MKKFIIVALLYLIHSINGQSKIMNGHSARQGVFPYQALIQGDQGFCGASIIHKRWLLTAAHCNAIYRNISSIKATVGTNDRFGVGGATYVAEAFITHERYSLSSDIVHNDIGLLRLKNDLKFNKNTNFIKLSNENSDQYVGKEAVITGWGTLYYYPIFSRTLQYIKVRVIRQRNCQHFWNGLTDEHLCTSIQRRQSTCQGDSGGPVVVQNVQVGIVSFGDYVCGVSGPDVHTRISSYYSWIEKQLKLYSNKLPE